MTSMGITFGDDAFDAMVSLAQHIPEGYNVALLADGEEVPAAGDFTPGVDVQLMSIDHDGVRFEEIDGIGEPTGIEGSRSWADIARIHVY